MIQSSESKARLQIMDRRAEDDEKKCYAAQP